MRSMDGESTSAYRRPHRIQAWHAEVVCAADTGPQLWLWPPALPPQACQKTPGSYAFTAIIRPKQP